MRLQATEVRRVDKPRGQTIYPQPIQRADGTYLRQRPYTQRDETHIKTRIYASPKGETVLDNFMGGRYTRPHQAVKALLVPGALQALGLDPATRVFWSQKAGCSCGCSPGFVADVRAGFDISITYEVVEEDEV